MIKPLTGARSATAPAGVSDRRRVRVQPQLVRAYLVVFTVAVVVLIAFPVPALMFSILIGVSVIPSARAWVPFTAVVELAALFSWMNVSKAAASDWFWYSSHYAYLEYTPLRDYLGRKIGMVRPEPSEPAYYAFARLVSVISGGNISTLSIAVTCVIYCGLGLSLILFLRDFGAPSWVVVISLVCGLSCGLTFTLTNQLVRQEMAGVLLALGGMLLVCHRRWLALAIILLVLSVLTHNSALLPALGILFARLIVTADRPFLRRTLLMLAVLVAFVAGRLYLADSGDAYYKGNSDGSVSWTVRVVDLILITACLLFARHRGDLMWCRSVRILAYFIPILYATVMAMYSQPIPFLRMYFFIELVRAFAIVYLVYVACSRSSSRYGAVLGIAFLVLAIAYVQIRIEVSPFVYGRDMLQSLMYSPLLRIA